MFVVSLLVALCNLVQVCGKKTRFSTSTTTVKINEYNELKWNKKNIEFVRTFGVRFRLSESHRAKRGMWKRARQNYMQTLTHTKVWKRNKHKSGTRLYRVFVFGCALLYFVSLLLLWGRKKRKKKEKTRKTETLHGAVDENEKLKCVWSVVVWWKVF